MSDLRIVLTAKDGVSKVFKEVASEADATGKAVSKAGAEGEMGFRRIGDSAKQAKVGTDELRASATAIGAVMGALGSVAIATGAAYKDQRLDIQSLESQYGSAADSIIKLTDVMQDSMNVSNDTARDMALTFATLYRNFEFGHEQIDSLMTRSADISAARGRSAAEVSQMVQNALRGEAEYIEQIGVTLNDTYVASQYAARGLGNWNTVVDEAAKAQFRYVLLMEQTVDTQGRAGEEAARAGGQFREFLNEMQDAGQVVGGFLGPVGEVAAEMAPLALTLPLISAGVGRMVPAIRGSSVAMSALGLATNPVVLGLAAIAAGGAFAWNQFQQGKEDAESLEAALRSLNDVQNQLLLSGEDQRAQAVSNMRDYIEEAKNVSQIRLDWSMGLTSAERQAQADAAGMSQGMWLKMMREEYTLTSEEVGRFAEAQTALGQAMLDPQVNADALSEHIGILFDQFMAGELTLDAFLAAMEEAATNTAQFRQEADATTQSVTGLGAAFKLIQGEAKGFVDELMKLNEITEDDGFGQRLMKTLGLDTAQRGQVQSTIADLRGLSVALEDMPGPESSQEDWTAWVNEAQRGSAEWNRRVAVANEARRAESEASAALQANEARNAALLALTNDQLEQGKGKLQEQIDLTIKAGEAIEEFLARRAELMADLASVAGVDDPLSTWNLSGNASDFAALADSVTDAGTALETTFRVVVGNTNAIGSQVDGIQTWADELINVAGEYGKIDDLLNAGLITANEYNAAQSAYNDITSSNADIQNYILEIQTRQAPLIADQTEALQNQMEVISDLPAQQQLIALGWMDATTAGRAMEFQQLAIAAAAGQIPQDAFESYIIGAAQADPVLRALLEDLELIAVDHEGNITINTEGAEGAISDVDQLKLSINALIEVLGGEVPALSIDVEGKDEVDAALDAVKNAPDEKNIAVNITEGTSPVGDVMRNLLNHVMGEGDGTGGAAYTIPVTTELDPAGLEALRIELATPVEVPVTFVSAASDVGAALGAGGGIGSGAGVEITVTAIDEATPAIASIVESAQDTFATVTIDAVDNASLTIGDVISFAASVDGYTSTLQLHATDSASTVIGDAVTFLSSIDGYTSTMNVAATDRASAVIGDAVSFLSSVDGYAATMAINAVDNASSVIGAAVEFLASVDGYESTVTLNMVTTTSTVNSRHGGIPGMAHGGIPVELAEAGPELLHFAGGGVMPVYDRGIYNVPPHTYVSPANANPRMGGVSISVNVNGPVFGITDLAAQVSDVLAPVIADVFEERNRGMGVS